VAAVEKIEEKRKLEDFFGHRNRIAAYNNRQEAVWLPACLGNIRSTIFGK